MKVLFGLISGIFGMVYIYYFWDFLGLNQNLYNIGMVIYGIFNAFNDPLLGQMSDRVDIQKYSSRRLIFIKYGGPIWAVNFFLMWFPRIYYYIIIIIRTNKIQDVKMSKCQDVNILIISQRIFQIQLRFD